MKRTLYRKLLHWKNTTHRKPLLLQGARQVGKTYLINEFGNNEYQHYVYLNFEQNSDVKSLFAGNLDPYAIMSDISLYVGKKITSADTLIFLDEIQIVPYIIEWKLYCQDIGSENNHFSLTVRCSVSKLPKF